MSQNRTVLLCAGGTGGHLFPAEAVALALSARGWRVELATDHRATGYGAEFPAAATHIVPSGTVTGGGVLGKLTGTLALGWGTVRSLAMVRSVKPAVAVGFGGYPTVPPMTAASLARVPTIIHDQNAVLGRANRFLAPRVTRIAVSSSRVKLDDALRRKAAETGNPVRAAVIEAARTPYPALTPDGPLHLAVFGGSQGARFLSEVMPGAVERLPAAIRGRLRIVQQCRPEDLDAVAAGYRRLGVEAELAPFFRDLPARIAASHLVVSRSGASTVAELAVIGRPAILIPLPGAIDQDQAANAALLSEVGGAWQIRQSELSPERMAAELTARFGDPAGLAAAAAAASRQGRPDAAERLADLVEAVAAAAPVVIKAGTTGMRREKGVDA